MPTSHFLDLASSRLSGEVLAANDEFFAPKDNLLNPAAPIFIADKHTDRGRWMDGWETRRRRTPGHDSCIVRLGVPGVIRSVVVDTAFFRGNFPSHCWLDACGLPEGATATDEHVEWHPIVARSELGGDMQNTFAVPDARRFTHVRLNIFPDGGVARLRVLGEPLPDWTRVLAAGEIDLASRVLGGHVVDTSDRFFGEPQNMLMPYPATMGDGWETKRRRGPGHDWAVVRLAAEALITRVEVATTHFEGNCPESCALEAAVLAENGGVSADVATHVGAHWAEVMPRTLLQPDQEHVLALQRPAAITATHVRLNIFPDGGVSRFRVFGRLTARARVSAVLRLLNAADGPDLRARLGDICGAPGWIDRMAAARPYASAAAALAASDAASRAVPQTEPRVAASEQQRLTRARLEQLLG